MKNIIASLGVIAFAGGVLFVGATGAFFSDTETSTGNVFTAGSINLQLDSLGFRVNGGPMQLAQGWVSGDPYGKFFDFPSMMPGDNGVRHLSLHNSSTDAAYVCINTSNSLEVNNAGEEIQVFAWRDHNPNGTYEPAGESAITASPVSIENLSGAAFADSSAGTPLGVFGASANDHLAVAWCAGTMSVNNTTGTISCDGAGMTTQGGSYIADMTIYAEQVNNNPNFVCSSLLPSNQ